MEQNLLNNKDLAVNLCKSIELVYSAIGEINSVKVDDYEKLSEHFEVIGEFFKIKDRLGILLICYFINKRLVNGKSYITLNELMGALNCNLVDSISINEQLEYFRKAKMVVVSKKTYGKKEDIEYTLTQITLNAVLKGDSEVLNNKKEMNFGAFLNLFHNVIYNDEYDDEEVSTEMKVTLERIFRVAINDNFSKYYFQNELLEKRSQLLTNDLIKFSGDSYMDSVQLTEKSIQALNISSRKNSLQFSTGSDVVSLIMPDKIQYQEGMVYEESLKIDFLEQLISEEGYIKAINKLSEENVETKQIVALLYGVSGLGKSQTVRNLAVKYNRPIIQVNLSQVKDAFVGNTEKNTQEVFNIYKKAVIHFEHTKKIDGKEVGPYGTPILYLDEFDSLIPHRDKSGASSSVGNMYSNMVGIFLTELERTNGIVLLSSNLPGAIDTSLHRRINFKFHFGTFSKQNQVRTLQLYFKDFEPAILEEVASVADLTPGNRKPIGFIQ